MAIPVLIPYSMMAPYPSGEFEITAPSPNAAIDVTASADATIAVTAPSPSMSFDASVNTNGLLTLVAPSPTASFADAGEDYAYPTYAVEVDWNNDGDWNDGNEDVTEDVLGLSGVAVQYGRDASQPFAPTAAGTAGMALDNFSDKYNPANQVSPLYGLLLPGRPVRMHATVGTHTYSIFTGHTDDSPVDPDDRAQAAEFSMLDNLAKLRSQKVSTELYWGIRTGAALNHILDEVGWPEDLRDIDVGGTVMPWWWASDANAYDAAVELVAAEGPPALLSVGPDGEIVFRDRHHRLARPGSRTVQAFFTARDFAEGTRATLSWSEVINHVEFEVTERAATATVVEVWQSDDIFSLADGETRIIRAQAPEPFFGAITPEIDVDYTVMQGTVLVTLARAAGQVAHIHVSAFGGPAVVSGMAVRAYSVPVARTRVVEREDTASIAKYGRRSWPGQAPFVNIHDARAQAAIILSTRADPLPKLTAKMIAVSATEIANQVARDLSDRIEVSGDSLLNGQWFIDSIEHRFTGRVGHETTFTCEAVPLQIGSVFIIGDPSNGVVGTNQLGRMALDEPDDVFIVGSSANGVLGTHVMAY